MAMAVTELAIHADFAGTSPDRMHRVVELLRRASFYGSQPLQSTLPLTEDISRFQAEFIACAAYVRRANYHFRKRYVELIRKCCETNSIEPPDNQLLYLVYDTAVGPCFSIDDIFPGSCDANASRKQPNLVVVGAFQILILLGGTGIAESVPGRAVIERVRDTINVSSAFIEQALTDAERRFPVIVQRRIEGVQCRVTLCTDPPRGP